MLELNRSSRSGDTIGDGTNGSIQAVNSSHARKLLHQNWDAGSSKPPVNQRSESTCAKTAVELPKPKLDYNLLAAFFILSVVVTFVLWLSYTMVRAYLFDSN